MKPHPTIIKPLDFLTMTFDQRPVREFVIDPGDVTLWFVDPKSGQFAIFMTATPVHVLPGNHCTFIKCPCCDKQALLILMDARDCDGLEHPVYLTASIPPDVVFRKV